MIFLTSMFLFFPGEGEGEKLGCNGAEIRAFYPEVVVSQKETLKI